MSRWEQTEREIMSVSTPEQLRLLREELHQEVDWKVDPWKSAGAVEEVNHFHDQLIGKALQLAEQRVRESYDSPPVSSFCMMLFGSGGRREQTLWSDQDNGMIYEPVPGADPEQVEEYMEQLGSSSIRILSEVGYPPCEGEVLASRKMWRQSLEEWRATLHDWFEQPSFEVVRHLLMVADARCIYGDDTLMHAFRQSYRGLLAERRSILPRMLQNTLRYKVLIGVLGNLLTEPYGEDAGGIDVKYGAYLPMVNAIRLLSLHYGIEATSTLERIDSLRGRPGVKQEWPDAWMAAFRTVLTLRSMTPLSMEDGMYQTRGVVTASTLTKPVRKELKMALRTGSELQRFVKRLYGSEGPR